MDSNEIRKSFLDFFEKKGHKIVPSSPLLPTDPSVLFTTAGMQQFKPYYTGEKSPYGDNTATCQKCIRTSDIGEVGNERHLTFFEMLGNFSFGGYFKREAINLAKEFLDSVKIKIEYVTVFEGDSEVPKDLETIGIWKELGFSEEKCNLHLCPKAENFWGPTGNEGPCGPTTEIYSGGIEIWNLVFNEYYCDKDKKLTKLEKSGVDTGMSLERLAMVIQSKKSVFETDLFYPLIEEIEKESKLGYEDNPKMFRIIADHVRSAVFLAGEGIIPSNIEQGYVLRRLLRRAIRYGKLLKMPKGFILDLAKKAVKMNEDAYPELKEREKEITKIIREEDRKFEKTLEKGIKELEAQIAENKSKVLSAKTVFDLYQSYGFPLELTGELAKEQGLEIDEEGFNKELEKHQEISRAGAQKKFGGVGKEATYDAVKLHTATHLLHQALRKVLGDSVRQMGSDINSERLRFDFSHSQKLTPEELKETEEIVNEKISEDLEVKMEEMEYREAVKEGALAFFKQKYPKTVSVYSIGKFSKEICAGPHVKRTSELGKFKIKKEESSSAGVRRIKAVLIK
ncbi:MAG: alanine--tRNA ligase-related protein [Candidatus Nealsonbacteria bacterium]|nr:alanine--tRNA ligase-related protein [Candidatus Nealsonbacteria bacterium]